MRVTHPQLNPIARRAFLGLGGAALLIASVDRAKAAGSDRLTLIMVDEINCSYCRKFDAEIGRGYNRTAEGQFAPLVKIRRKARELAGFNPVIYTPTFLLVRRDEELGRITGYPGSDFFYPELDQLLAKVGFAPGLSSPSPSVTRT